MLEGGDIFEERLRSARETAKRPVAGFVLDGFQSTSMEQELRKQLITAVTEELPQDKPRYNPTRSLTLVSHLCVRVPLSRSLRACCALCFTVTSPITDYMPSRILFRSPRSRGLSSHQLPKERCWRREGFSTKLCVHAVLMNKFHDLTSVVSQQAVDGVGKKEALKGF